MFSASVFNRATRLHGWHLCGTVSALKIATGLGDNLVIGSECVFGVLPIPLCSLHVAHAPSPCRDRNDDQRKPVSPGRESGGEISCSLVAEKAGMEEYREQQGDLDWMQVRRRTRDGRRACT